MTSPSYDLVLLDLFCELYHLNFIQHSFEGFCQTDMSSHRGNKTAAQGAETPVWLALQPNNSNLKQGFYSDKKEIDW